MAPPNDSRRLKVPVEWLAIRRIGARRAHVACGERGRGVALVVANMSGAGSGFVTWRSGFLRARDQAAESSRRVRPNCARQWDAEWLEVGVGRSEPHRGGTNDRGPNWIHERGDQSDGSPSTAHPA